MTDSAERPLIGPETEDAGDQSMAPETGSAGRLAGTGDDELKSRVHYPGRTSFDMPAFSAQDRDDDDDDDDDGPVIKRIPVISRTALARDTGHNARMTTPRLFANQLDADFEAAGPSSTPVPRAFARPAPLADDWYREEDGPDHSYSREFSVAAVRAQRMRTPAGTHHPTSMATKVTIFSLASVCLVAAGVSLGLYGQDLRYHIERNAQLASASVQDARARLATSSTASLGSSSQASLSGLPGGTAADRNAGGPRELVTGSTTTAPPAGGRKLIYARLPSADASIAPEQQSGLAGEKPENTAALDALLATPADFLPPAAQTD